MDSHPFSTRSACQLKLISSRGEIHCLVLCMQDFVVVSSVFSSVVIHFKLRPEIFARRFVLAGEYDILMYFLKGLCHGCSF